MRMQTSAMKGREAVRINFNKGYKSYDKMPRHNRPGRCLALPSSPGECPLSVLPQHRRA